MRDTKIAELPPLWICPRCGARLVSRNLWHSCGQFTLEDLFANSAPGVFDLAREYVALLHSLGDVQVIPQKTRLVCVARVRFAGLTPRKRGLLANFALHRWLDSPRIVKTVDYGPRWRAHFVHIQSSGDVDDIDTVSIQHVRYERLGGLHGLVADDKIRDVDIPGVLDVVHARERLRPDARAGLRGPSTGRRPGT